MLGHRPRLVAAIVLVAALVLAGTRGRAANPGRPQREQSLSPLSDRLAEMQHHYLQVTLVHEAVIRGDLPAARASAMEIVGMPVSPEMTGTELSLVQALKAAAGQVAEATDVASAASAMAMMLRQCGECHQTVVRPAPSVTRRPELGGLVGHMLEHQRAADELLLGLIVPSASQWSRGAARLRVAPLRSDELPSDPGLTDGVRRTETRVHDIAERAASVSEPMARGTLYGELMATCAECHSLHSRVWGPGRR